MEFIRITLVFDGEDQASYIEKLENICADSFPFDPELDEHFRLELIQITKAEFDKLPEFKGF